jgi:hypothetical protein
MLTKKMKLATAIVTVLFIAIFFKFFRFSGEVRTLHTPFTADLSGQFQNSKMPATTFAFMFQPVETEFDSMKNSRAAQRNTTRVTFIIRATDDCPSFLIAESGRKLANLEQCQHTPHRIANFLKLKNREAFKIATYRFENIIKPGRTLISFAGQNEESTTINPLILKTDKLENGGQTILALSHRTVRASELVQQLLRRGKFRLAAYFFATLTLICAWILVTTKPKISLTLTLIAMVLALLGLLPHFSGNDETAHFGMLTHAAGGSALHNPPIDLLSQRVNIEARELMYHEDFLQLHKVNLPPKGECLHMIIGSCGFSEQPKNFYKYFYSWLNQDVFESYQVKQILTFIRLQNVIVTALALILFCQLFRVEIGTIAPILIIFGGAFSSIVALTNDIYGILLGLYLTFLQYSIIKTDIGIRRQTLALLLGMLGFYVGLKIDSNAYSALPVICITGILLVHKLYQANIPNQFSRDLKIPIAFAVLTLSFYLLSRRYFNHGINSLNESFRVPEDINLIGMIGKISLTDVFRFNLELIRGLFGRYLWSHSTYPTNLTTSILILLFLTSIFCYLKSYAFSGQNASKLYTKLSLIPFLMAQYLGLLLMMEALVGLALSNVIPVWTFLVPRFYYPGIAVIFVPLMILLTSESVQKFAGSQIAVAAISLLWATSNILYFFPQFFLADAW